MAPRAREDVIENILDESQEWERSGVSSKAGSSSNEVGKGEPSEASGLDADPQSQCCDTSFVRVDPSLADASSDSSAPPARQEELTLHELARENWTCVIKEVGYCRLPCCDPRDLGAEQEEGRQFSNIHHIEQRAFVVSDGWTVYAIDLDAGTWRRVCATWNNHDLCSVDPAAGRLLLRLKNGCFSWIGIESGTEEEEIEVLEHEPGRASDIVKSLLVLDDGRQLQVVEEQCTGHAELWEVSRHVPPLRLRRLDDLQDYTEDILMSEEGMVLLEGQSCTSLLRRHGYALRRERIEFGPYFEKLFYPCLVADHIFAQCWHKKKEVFEIIQMDTMQILKTFAVSGIDTPKWMCPMEDDILFVQADPRNVLTFLTARIPPVRRSGVHTSRPSGQPERRLRSETPPG